MSTVSHAEATAGAPIDAAFIEKVLTPYRDHCRYLKRATVLFEGEPGWETMRMRGEFAIDASCYIDDTGHFNAVEFNICYNQLAYVHLAHCIQHRLMPALDRYSMAQFYEKQLANFLIANINSSYHAPINPRQFVGEVRVASARSRSRFSILHTTCKFNDAGEGKSDGEVKLVVLHP